SASRTEISVAEYHDLEFSIDLEGRAERLDRYDFGRSNVISDKECLSIDQRRRVRFSVGYSLQSNRREDVCGNRLDARRRGRRRCIGRLGTFLRRWRWSSSGNHQLFWTRRDQD